MKPCALFIALIAAPAFADDPVVQAVSTTRTHGLWRFDVTLTHPDSGWDHYADGWQIQDLDGQDLGTRVLVHPHEHEQPFTRSLAAVLVPEGTAQVRIIARCLVDGWASTPFIVDLK